MKTTICIIHFLFIVSLASAQSILETENLFSPNLGIEKTYQVYLPDGYYDNVESYPVVYFFRLNYWEWFNTDARPDNTALQDIADELFNTGQIGKMILVGVDLGGAPLGKEIDWGMVNMLRPELVNSEGIGNSWRFSY